MERGGGGREITLGAYLMLEELVLGHELISVVSFTSCQ